MSKAKCSFRLNKGEKYDTLENCIKKRQVRMFGQNKIPEVVLADMLKPKKRVRKPKVVELEMTPVADVPVGMGYLVGGKLYCGVGKPKKIGDYKDAKECNLSKHLRAYGEFQTDEAVPASASYIKERVVRTKKVVPKLTKKELRAKIADALNKYNETGKSIYKAQASKYRNLLAAPKKGAGCYGAPCSECESD